MLKSNKKKVASIHYLYRLSARVMGKLEPITANFRQVTSWTGRQTIAVLTQKQTDIHTQYTI